MAKKQTKKFLPKTESEAGVEWLNSLDEVEFRDKILADLFRGLKNAGVIAGAKNVHGRNEHGIDYIYRESSLGITPRFVGVQVKSSPIKVSSGSKSPSILEIRRQCEDSFRYDFDFEGDQIRLDNVEVWNSSTTTKDAETALNAPRDQLKIRLKKDQDIFNLIENYCPKLLAKVPECALLAYLQEQKNPSSKKFVLLGRQINVRDHFIEPYLSSEDPDSISSIESPDSKFTTTLDKIKLGSENILIIGNQLSGKSYILERIRFVLANEGKVPILVPAEWVANTNFSDPYALAAKRLGFLSRAQLRSFDVEDRLVILVDDFETLSRKKQDALLAEESEGIKIVAASAGTRHPEEWKCTHYHLDGVQISSVKRLLRNLDSGAVSASGLVDRADALLRRVFGQPGLPFNPFTVAMVLEDCALSPGRFSTPTFGRLIERFISLQLGSHSDLTNRVDYETKMSFLNHISGAPQIEYRSSDFRREIGKFIQKKRHPHNIADFFDDLNDSGAFELSPDGRFVRWTHPVIKLHFWTSALLSKGRLDPILKALCASENPSLSALVGSKMGDAKPVIQELMGRIPEEGFRTSDVELPQLADVIRLFPDDAEERRLLSSLETDDESQDHATEEGKPKKAKARGQITEEQRKEILRKVEPILLAMGEQNFHIAFNLASVLINARDTPGDLKEMTVKRVVNSIDSFGGVTEEYFSALGIKDSRLRFLMKVLRYHMGFALGDALIADPHLKSVFEFLKSNSGSDNLQRLRYLDLLVCCGEFESDEVVDLLTKIDKVEVAMAFYFRLLSIYHFRFHRPEEKRKLRKLLKRIRSIYSKANLPAVPPSGPRS